MNFLYNKVVGIWGYGVTGKAACAHAQRHGARCTVLFDSRALSQTERENLHTQGITIYTPTHQQQFLHDVDIIIKSPGVALPDLDHDQRSKIISEYDLFSTLWSTKTIAVTGTVGKTTVTSCLTQLLNAVGTTAVAAGNIGIPMLQVVDELPHARYAVVELSSCHTELGLQYGPDLAIITNIHPNHLDRHGTLEAYRNAKLELIRAQKDNQIALLPLSLAPVVRTAISQPRAYVWFSGKPPEHQERLWCHPQDTLYYYDENGITREHHSIKSHFPQPPCAPTFAENILIMTAALHELGYDPHNIIWNKLAIPEHRLRAFATYNNITFYNDSKSTIPAATLAAVQQLKNHNIILFIGGVSKGVDREPFIRALSTCSNIRHVACFGAEATQLAQWCHEVHLCASASPTLDRAYDQTLSTHAQPGDVVLFSPAGASFDLFKNYEERGDYFMKLVHAR